MPSQQEVQWSQLKVGVLVLVALAVLIGLIFLMSGNTGGIFTGKITVRSYFENSAGLKVGAPVNLEGVTIGNVKIDSHRPRPQADARRSHDEAQREICRRPAHRLQSQP